MNAVAWIVATVGGVGYAPIASGTVASLVAAAIWYALPWNGTVQWVACAAAALVGLWASGRIASRLKDDDPSIVVIDEVAGMWISLAALPRTWPVIMTGFLLFRFFDIGKFPPMKQLEHLHGGWGIMLDDVAAGLISRAALGVLVWLFPRLAGVG